MLNAVEGQWPFWWILAALALLMMVRPAMGMPPLARVQEDNLAAAEILIGQVEAVKPAPAAFRQMLAPGTAEEPWIFTLRVSHVVKSQARTQVGDQVSVLFPREKEGISKVGLAPVRVSPGDLLIVYVNPKEQQGHRVLVPVWAGFSVVRLGPPPQPGEAVRAPGAAKSD